jgi:uncharacterized protein
MSIIIDFLTNRRQILGILTLIFGAIIAWGMQYTSIDSSSNAILAEDDPYWEEVQEVDRDFPPSSGVVFAFMPKDGNIFSRNALFAMEELTERYTEIDSSVAVGSLINRRLDAVDADIYNRDYLIPDISGLDQADLDQIREIALADEDLTKTSLSPEGDMALASVKYRASPDDQPTRRKVAMSVVELRDSLRENYPDINIYILGRSIFELDSYKAQINDRTYLAPLVLFFNLILLWYCLRSIPYSLSVIAVSFVTIALTVGTMGWAKIPFNQISNMGPLVVLTIALADSIHIVSVYVQGLHKSMSKVEAMRHSIAVNVQPVTLATITTTMGFLSLNYCASPGIYGFGNVVAIGVVWAFVVTFTLLPAMVLLVPVKSTPKPLGIKGLVTQVTALVHRRPNMLLALGAAIILGTLALLPLNKVDFSRFSFVDEDSDFHEVFIALSEKIGNDQSLVYSINSGGYYGITEPQFVAEIEKFTLWLEEQPEATLVSSYLNFLKIQNMAENDNDEAFKVIPTDNLQIIDYLVSYQLVQEIEPNLSPIFNPDYSAIRVSIGTSNLSNTELVEFNYRIERWMEENLNPDYRVMHGDNSILYARLEHSISVQLIEGFGISFILITLTLLVGLRSIRYGLISMIPNLFPATIVFGFWGLFVGELSPYVLMLFSISIGLVVDDSVHVLSKYIHARRRGAGPDEAVDESLDKAGSAITITTLTLAVGTALLVFSNTSYYQSVATLLTPIIVVALLLDTLFLPPLLVKFDRWLEGRVGLPSPAKGAQETS